MWSHTARIETTTSTGPLRARPLILLIPIGQGQTKRRNRLPHLRQRKGKIRNTARKRSNHLSRDSWVSTPPHPGQTFLSVCGFFMANLLLHGSESDGRKKEEDNSFSQISEEESKKDLPYLNHTAIVLPRKWSKSTVCAS